MCPRYSPLTRQSKGISVDDSKSEDPAILHSWTARKLQPEVVLYVLAVFIGFIALALFVFHSSEAVFALAATAVGSIVPMIPMVLNRTEFQMTEVGLRKRTVSEKEPKAFKEVFSWEELSYTVPVKHGFKFFKRFEATNRISTFWKTHLTEGLSGEFQVESGERDAVLEVLAHYDIPTSKLIRP